MVFGGRVVARRLLGTLPLLLPPEIVVGLGLVIQTEGALFL